MRITRAHGKIRVGVFVAGKHLATVLRKMETRLCPEGLPRGMAVSPQSQARKQAPCLCAGQGGPCTDGVQRVYEEAQQSQRGRDGAVPRKSPG